jgi:hypothetical protein
METKVSEMEARHKEEKARMKEEMDDLKYRRQELAGEVAARKGRREVDVVDIAYWSDGVVKTIAARTGSVIATRPIKPEEQQTQLFAGVPGGPRLEETERDL